MPLRHLHTWQSGIKKWLSSISYKLGSKEPVNWRQSWELLPGQGKDSKTGDYSGQI